MICVEILVGGADDAHVDLDRAMPADPLDHLILQEAQQLDLHRQRQVADFVEEQRAAIGALDLADGLLHRAGEGALLMAEQLAFQQGLGDRRAIDRDEGLLGARAQAVDRLRQHLLAGAAFAKQQHGDIGRRDLLDGAQRPRHLRARRDDAVDRRARRQLDQPAILALELGELRGALEHVAQQIDIDRLLVEIIGAERDGAQRGLVILLACRDDDLGLGRGRKDRLERDHAFAHRVGLGRQAEIENHNRRPRAAEFGDRILAVAGDRYLAIGERPAILADEPLIVLDHKNVEFRVFHDPKPPSRRPLLSRAEE